MIAQFKHHDESRNRLLDDYCEYIKTFKPLFTVEDEMIHFMDINNIDYFKVGKKNCKKNCDVFFKFNVEIFKEKDFEYKLFTYDKVYEV